jgi:hypothetical protein
MGYGYLSSVHRGQSSRRKMIIETMIVTFEDDVSDFKSEGRLPNYDTTARPNILNSSSH